MNINNMLKKYASLAVKKGVNLQKGQVLMINTPIECYDFARVIAEEAYREGAKEVIVRYSDQVIQRLTLENASIETLSNIPDWFSESYNKYAKEGCCVISVSASDPDAYKGVPADKISAYQQARSKALKEYFELSMANKIRWTVVSVPTDKWAKKIFKDTSTEEAVNKLWDQIFKVVRLYEEDPIKAWDEHNSKLHEKMDFLNSQKFKSLHYTNNRGTDLTIELPEGHIWCGGSEHCYNGIEFNANMPTEEVFTMPKRDAVNGTVVSSKPLIYGGNVIDKFKLTFKNGKVVDFTAEEGYDTLKKLLDTDEGASYLGEVALVPYDSPISNSNIIFYNTLFDENASCHLAFGAAYPINMENGENMTKEELLSKGANDSIIHEDFMIGTEDLNITGINKDGEKIQIFLNGNWAI